MADEAAAATPEAAAPAANEAVNPAPDQAATATPEAEVSASADKPEDKQPPAKTFSQEDLDREIGKRLAKEQRKFERDTARRIAEAVAQVTPKPQTDIKPDQYSTTEQYVEALASKKAAEIVDHREREREAVEVDARWAEAEEAAIEKYGDYDAVVKHNANLPITAQMADIIKRSEMGGDIAYHLGTNPKEADRIAKLSPFLQAKEIGRIEAKLAANPPEAKKASKAPEPINPIKPRGDSPRTYDTTDPRSLTTMTTSEWIEADRKRQVKILESRMR